MTSKDAQWWITGGFDNDQLTSTEIYNVTQNDFFTYVELPKAMHYSNAVAVSDTETVFLGKENINGFFKYSEISILRISVLR